MKNIKTMKKKRAGKSVGTADPEDPEQSVNYLVGQVSGSLFPSKPTKKSSSLSSLFKTETPSASLIFVPAPKPAPKRPEPSVEESDGNTEETSAPPAKKTKPSKEKSAAEKKVEDRESALKNAEDNEGRKKSPGPPRVKARRHGGTGPVDAEEGEQAGKKKAVNRAEERIKNKRTVFVGNLPVTCTKKMLKALFKEHGSIESIRFRSVIREDASVTRKVAAIQRKIHPKRQSINAYIVFKAEEEAANAVKRNGLEIEKGFHIRVDRANKTATHDHKRSIFVGNLPYDINELPLRQHFEECGQVEAVRLVRDRDSGMGKGFGYVLFENIDAVQIALQLDNSQLLGRRIRVKRSVKKEKVKKAAPGGKPSRDAVQSPGGAAGRKERGPATPGFRGKPAPGFKESRPTGFKGRPARPPRAGSFKGEMAKPGNDKNRKSKGPKKKLKPKKGQKVPNF